MKWYEATVDETLTKLGSQAEFGLSTSTAMKRLKKSGKNQLTEGKAPLGLTLFIKQFKDFMVIVLLIATFIAAYLGEVVDGEILVMLFAMVLGFPLPLLPVQILWINLVTDGLPALALGMDASEKNLMEQPPRPIKEGIFARGLGFKIVSRGFLIGCVSFLAFVLAYQNGAQSLQYARTVAFMTLVTAQLIHVFDCRSERSIFDRHPFGNRYLIVAVLSSFALVIPVIYVDTFQVIFQTVGLSIRDWLTIILLSAVPTIVFSFTKR